MKNDKKEKRTTVRFTDDADKRLNVIEGDLITRGHRDVSRDDIINHVITRADRYATVEALSGGRK